jgi:hypothetical protein
MGGLDDHVGGVLHRKRPDAVLIATVLVGVAERVLNVPDRVRPFVTPDDFDARVVPRLSSGDETLWDEFPHAVSRNRPGGRPTHREEVPRAANPSAREDRPRGL